MRIFLMHGSFCIYSHGNISKLCPGYVLAVVGGGECLPSNLSDSDSFCSPCMTARPNRNLSANDVALVADPGFLATITAFLQSGIFSKGIIVPQLNKEYQ